MLSQNYQNALKDLRKSRNLTQDELGDIIGVSAQTIYKYENGVTFPPVENLEKLLDYFKVDPNTLFSTSISEPTYLDRIRQIIDRERNFQFSIGISLRNSADLHDRLIDQYPGLKGHSTDFILSFHKYRLESEILRIINRISENAFEEARNFDDDRAYLSNKLDDDM